MPNFLHTYLGLDLGQRTDHSALAVLDVVEVVGHRRDPVTFALKRSQHLNLRVLTRYPLGTPYTGIPDHVRRALVNQPAGHFGPPLQGTLAIDAGGPGLPVVELVRGARLGVTLMPVIITGSGPGSHLNGGVYTVPRRELVSLVRIALESGILFFPPALPLRDDLTAELAALESTGGQSHHDDLAIALALALWATRRHHPTLWKTGARHQPSTE